jgi:hypothetical protein
MALFLFKISAYALLALASATFLAVLKRRLRQRSLCKIPGPSNPSFFWGKIHELERTGRMLNWMRRSLASYVQPPCLYVLRRTIQDIWKSSTRLWFFWGRSNSLRFRPPTPVISAIAVNRTYNLWCLIRRHATILSSRIKPFSRQRRFSSCTFYFLSEVRTGDGL